ncbi:MAG: nicotinate phosphoribosyltransferase [Bacteroidia bacterium]|nr:nicotinate phosphoribosyltransferase [Bacteroidia bacterium]
MMTNSASETLGLYTDFYELSMAQGYFLAGKKDEKTVFDYFYRTNPYEGGFLVFAGLEDLLNLLTAFRYSEENLKYLEKHGFCPEFLDYLKDFSFNGTIFSVREGEIVFPNEPILRVEGNIIEAQLIETLLLNILNFGSLIATKAFRIKLVCGEKSFADFGLRRAHGIGGIQASRAAIIGGASSTSNVQSGFLYDIPVSGTMAHSWVQSFDDELTAFHEYARFNPDRTVLLVDTYDTLRSGIPNTIIVAKEMEAMENKLIGIRLDSGDLAYLSKKARKMLDAAGLEYVKIFASNQLNEYVINSLNEQHAPLDAYGVGTELITGKPDAALDGVYKLALCNGTPRMKISENIEKMTYPGRKSLYRYFDSEGNFFRDGILLENEDPDDCDCIYNPVHPDKCTTVAGLKRENLHNIVYENNMITNPLPSPQQCHEYLMSRAALLPAEHKRFIMPHIYKVGSSKELLELRDQLRKKIGNKSI